MSERLPEFRGIAAALAEDAAAGRLLPERLALAASLGDKTAKALLGPDAPKGPRGVTAWWTALGPAQQAPEVGVRALVAVAEKLAGEVRGGAAKAVRPAVAAAAAWAREPSDASASAARDAAIGAVERYQAAPARMRPVVGADEAVGIIAMHAAWSAGILPRLSYDAAEWSLLLERALEATGVSYRAVRRVVDRTLIPWALGLDPELSEAYVKRGAGKKRKGGGKQAKRRG